MTHCKRPGPIQVTQEGGNPWGTFQRCPSDWRQGHAGEGSRSCLQRGAPKHPCCARLPVPHRSPTDPAARGTPATAPPPSHRHFGPRAVTLQPALSWVWGPPWMANHPHLAEIQMQRADSHSGNPQCRQILSRDGGAGRGAHGRAEAACLPCSWRRGHLSKPWRPVETFCLLQPERRKEGQTATFSLCEWLPGV